MNPYNVALQVHRKENDMDGKDGLSSKLSSTPRPDVTILNHNANFYISKEFRVSEVHLMRHIQIIVTNFTEKYQPTSSDKKH